MYLWMIFNLLRRRYVFNQSQFLMCELMSLWSVRCDRLYILIFRVIIQFCHYQVNREDLHIWLYVYFEHRYLFLSCVNSIVSCMYTVLSCVCLSDMLVPTGCIHVYWFVCLLYQILPWSSYNQEDTLMWQNIVYPSLSCINHIVPRVYTVLSCVILHVSYCVWILSYRLYCDK